MAKQETQQYSEDTISYIKQVIKTLKKNGNFEKLDELSLWKFADLLELYSRAKDDAFSNELTEQGAHGKNISASATLMLKTMSQIMAFCKEWGISLKTRQYLTRTSESTEPSAVEKLLDGLNN